MGQKIDLSTWHLRSDPARWHVPLLLLVSSVYESLFVRNGINPFDEGWPLYAATQLHAGGTLYQDVFWVFPPGALLPAWLSVALDPPGILLTRYFYAAFSVLLCSAIYVLGRQLMAPTYALLAGLLVAVAAPESHVWHAVFGYRYLLFSALALLCFSVRLRSGRLRWTFFAGCLTGIALMFRLTPAFAVAVGIAVGILVVGDPWKRRLREGACFASGLVLLVAPGLIYLGVHAGLTTVWREAVVRPVLMTQLQSLPIPTPFIPAGLGRWELQQAFDALEFWIYPALYLAFVGWLSARWLRGRKAGERFGDTLLLATAVWGGVFLLRSYGRADVYHMESALPPVCLLIAYLVQPRGPSALRQWTRDALRVTSVLGVWIVLQGVDLYASRDMRGTAALASLDDRVSTTRGMRTIVDPAVEAIERNSSPGETLLDLSASPLLHVLTGRPGVGHADVVLPGTFLNAAEQSALLDRIEQQQPAIALIPLWTQDARPERAPAQVAPRIFEWLQERYVIVERLEHYLVLVPAR